MADPTLKTMNHDVVGMDARLNRFITEFYKSVSSSQGDEYIPFDVTRAEKYLGAITKYQAWVTDQPMLDCPETAPRMYDLAVRPVVDLVENESVNDMIRMMIIARDELANSQSARRPCGFNEFDNARLSSYVLKMEKFLSDFVAVATPLDLPESSPKAPTSGAGRTGVEPS
jgi:hypothetical protein